MNIHTIFDCVYYNKLNYILYANEISQNEPIHIHIRDSVLTSTDFFSVLL